MSNLYGGKMNIYIWGAGKGYKMMKEALDYYQVTVLGFLDNDSRLWECKVDEFNVYNPMEKEIICDYILISVVNGIDEVKKQLSEIGINKDKILAYYDEADFKVCQVNFINHAVRTLQFIDRKIRSSHLKLECIQQNMEYEIADRIRKGRYEFPHIESAEEALYRVLKDGMSICRFGDTEFEAIFLRNRSAYQNESEELARRLKEILVNRESNIITCIADNYGDLSRYTERSAMGIRGYMRPDVRKDHMSVIDLGKIYYDAYVSRPYIQYQDLAYAKRLFGLWKQVWKDRKVVVVEGRFTKSGFDNDLFADAANVERLLCPTENAWDCYEEIYNAVLQKITKDKLVLIVLGPTATVLAYDLALIGYQAIDMGQLDNEYEWYMRRATRQIPIKNKYVYESGEAGRITEDTYDPKFDKQVICKIGC